MVNTNLEKLLKEEFERRLPEEVLQKILDRYSGKRVVEIRIIGKYPVEFGEELLIYMALSKYPRMEFPRVLDLGSLGKYLLGDRYLPIQVVELEVGFYEKNEVRWEKLCFRLYGILDKRKVLEYFRKTKRK